MVLEQRCKARKPGLCGEGAGAERERQNIQFGRTEACIYHSTMNMISSKESS